MTGRGLRQLESVTRGSPPPGGGGTSSPAGSGHVLVVDDGSALARGALVPVLRRAGYRPLVLQVPGAGGVAGDGSLAAPVVRAGGHDNDAWKRRFSAAEQARLLDTIGPTMRACGYDV